MLPEINGNDNIPFDIFSVCACINNLYMCIILNGIIYAFFFIACPRIIFPLFLKNHHGCLFNYWRSDLDITTSVPHQPVSR